MLRVRFETPAVAAKASFAVAQRLQAMPPPSNLLEEGRRWWSSVERHNRVARRRRALVMAADSVREHVSPDVKVYANVAEGIVYLDRVQVFQVDIDSKVTVVTACAEWHQCDYTKALVWLLLPPARAS